MAIADGTMGVNRRWGWRLAFAAGLTVCVALALLLLYSRVCAYTNFKDGTSGDYARYTNAIWNTAHGRPFVHYITESYLAVHLSYALALLSPLFLVFDHPFLLAFVQWAFLIGGGAIVWRLCVRLGVPGHFTMALLLFWLMHPFAQSVVLCEFHGVSTYFVTIPWLYYCLLFRRGWVWAPLLLVLGLREDAGLVVVPLLLYFAVKDRWRAGYVYAGVALAYVVLACLVLYPAVNGISLLARRTAEIPIPGQDEAPISGSMTALRLRSLGAILLIVLPFLLRGWKPLLVIPLAALVITLGSGYHSQVVLRIHYPAVILALLAVALLESWRRMAIGKGRFDRVLRIICSVYLAGWTVLTGYRGGFMQTGRTGGADARLRAYRRIDANGVHAHWVARRHVPREGVLWTDKRLGGFVANRADMSYAASLLSDPRYPEIMVFCPRAGLPDVVRAGLESGTWGALYFDSNYLVLRRGGDTAINATLLKRLSTPTIRIATSSRQLGDNVFVPGPGVVRHWAGQRKKWPAVVSYAKSVSLPPGRHVARFTLKAEPGRKPGQTPQDTGLLALYVRDTDRKLAEAQISMEPSGLFKEQAVPFVLDAGADVEPRIYGGGARLWLLTVAFGTD